MKNMSKHCQAIMPLIVTERPKAVGLPVRAISKENQQALNEANIKVSKDPACDCTINQVNREGKWS